MRCFHRLYLWSVIGVYRNHTPEIAIGDLMNLCGFISIDYSLLYLKMHWTWKGADVYCFSHVCVYLFLSGKRTLAHIMNVLTIRIVGKMQYVIFLVPIPIMYVFVNPVFLTTLPSLPPYRTGALVGITNQTDDYIFP